MSAISRRAPKRRRGAAPRTDDPRIVRSRAAAIEAATTLFLEKGYAGTTMEEIAALAGLSKRTLYNNYTDKSALFTQIVTDVITFAEAFAQSIRAEFTTHITGDTLATALHNLARRLALGILRPEVIALRRLLVREGREFPALAKDYFHRAPDRVMTALADGFEHLTDAGVLNAIDARRAAEQFAYLVVGEPLDRAMVVGTTPTRAHIVACARDGVDTFLARYRR